MAENPEPAPAHRQFPCKQCGAKLDFAPGSESLKCPYCGGETPIPRSEAEIRELDYNEYLKKLAGEHETTEEHRVKCAKCGAETTMPKEAAAGTCPFCSANLVLTTQLTRLLKPKALLPFKVTRQEGLTNFRQWLRGLWFAPSDLKRYAQSEGKLAGIYVPYWTYDSDTTSFYRGERGDDYSVSETYNAFENGRAVSKTRQVRRTRWTPASGTVWNCFDDVLVMASPSLPQKYAEQLEPWDLANLVPYSDEYLSGFLAESYQVELQSGFEIARTIMDEGIQKSIRRDIGGDHQRIDAVKTSYDKITFKHILLPVWLSAYRYRERIYRILINARTGELQGERPYSSWKIAAAIIVVAVIIAIIAFVGSSSH
jgi:DNA-directed RNA polymerase subunit RPC12/RpoP